MIGFRIFPRPRAIDAELVRAFRALPVANVSDAMGRMFAAGAALKPVHLGGVLAGPALTVRTRPGDNLMVHKAIDLAVPGDVVVVDGGGDLTNALIGDLMSSYAASRGIAGLVIHGAVRDLAVLREREFPIFAAGATHRGPYKDGPGEINVPVALGGMVVGPGDLILGDQDGLVCIGIDEAETVLAATQAIVAFEHDAAKAIAAGRYDRRWVDQRLKQLGCAGV